MAEIHFFRDVALAYWMMEKFSQLPKPKLVYRPGKQGILLLAAGGQRPPNWHAEGAMRQLCDTKPGVYGVHIGKTVGANTPGCKWTENGR